MHRRISSSSSSGVPTRDRAGIPEPVPPAGKANGSLAEPVHYAGYRERMVFDTLKTAESTMNGFIRFAPSARRVTRVESTTRDLETQCMRSRRGVFALDLRFARRFSLRRGLSQRTTLGAMVARRPLARTVVTATRQRGSEVHAG